MNLRFQMIYFSSGDWSCASSVWAIWYVPLIVCSKQLLCTFVSFSLVNTAAITFSCCPFHTFHSHLLSLSIQLCRWGGGGVLFNHKPFTGKITRAIHLVECGWIHRTFSEFSPRGRKIWYTDIFLPRNGYAGKWNYTLKIRAGLRQTGGKKMGDKVHGWQSMKWTKVTGSWGRNGKLWHMSYLDYQDMITLRVCWSQIKEVVLQNLIPGMEKDRAK